VSDRTSATGDRQSPPDGTTTAAGSAIEVSWDCTRVDGVTFVGIRVRNPASVPRRVRLANRLDGPVLPPRSGGSPEPGYDADGVTVGVAASDCEPVGYACPAGPPADGESPVRIAAVDRVPDAAAVPEPSPAERARTGLGDATPPRDAVPTAGPASAEKPQRAASAVGRQTASSPTGDASDAADGTSDAVRDDGVPPECEEWLAAVAARVETAERLTDASVPAATEALAAAAELDGVDGDGVDAAADLDRRLAGDAERLRELAARAESLAERAAAADPPVEALCRLA